MFASLLLSETDVPMKSDFDRRIRFHFIVKFSQFQIQFEKKASSAPRGTIRHKYNKDVQPDNKTILETKVYHKHKQATFLNVSYFTNGLYIVRNDFVNG